MFQKDYLKRKIDIFFEELVLFLSKKPPKQEKKKKIAEFSQRYTQRDIAYFVNLPTKTIIAVCENKESLEIVAELLFHIADESVEIAKKTKEIFEHLDRISNEYSFDRNKKIGEINDLIKGF